MHAGLLAVVVEEGLHGSLHFFHLDAAHARHDLGHFQQFFARQAAQHGGSRFFAGPRQEGFYVDLENTFDLLNLGANGGYKNTLLGKNVHSLAIEVPITDLTLDGAAPDPALNNQVIAAWATTSRRAAVIRRSDGLGTAHRGDWVQVARLGNPLVNEVVLPISMKDTFNKKGKK